MKMYEVGGCVRDEIMGVPSHDIDFTVVLEEEDFITSGSANAFNVMNQNLRRMGFKVFLETPEFFTIRAQFPRGYWTGEQKRTGMTADFVLARKEGDYDGRRPGVVEPGTLEDDLARRDFTMNAIAKSAEGTLIDPFNGMADIEKGIIRTVGEPLDRFTEDALRAVRALRFAVTKGFKIEARTAYAMNVQSVIDDIAGPRISDDRIRAELEKMFAFDSVAAMSALSEFPALTEALFSGSVWLQPTMKKAKVK